MFCTRLLQLGLSRGKTDVLLHHSDQSSQYTSEQFQRLLADNGVACSMSWVCNVWRSSLLEVLHHW